MVSTEEEVEVDAVTAAAIGRGIRAADEGRVVSNETFETHPPVDFQVLYTEPALADLVEVMRWSWQNHPGTTERFAKMRCSIMVTR